MLVTIVRSSITFPVCCDEDGPLLQHVIMDLLRAIDAYTSHMDIPNSAIIYYTIVRRDIDLIKSGCYIAVTIVSDALIVSRPLVVVYFTIVASDAVLSIGLPNVRCLGAEQASSLHPGSPGVCRHRCDTTSSMY